MNLASEYPKIASLKRIKEQHESFLDELIHLRKQLAEAHLDLARHKAKTVILSQGELNVLKQLEVSLLNQIESLEEEIKNFSIREGNLKEVENKIRLLEEKFIR